MNKKFFLLTVFVGVFSVWINATSAANTIMSQHPCDDEASCKSICTDGKFTKITITTGFGGYNYYCNNGYESEKTAAGNAGSGEKCTNQNDCGSGLYCAYKSVGEGWACQAKMSDGAQCGDKGVTLPGSAGFLCPYACSSGKYYESKTNIYTCGTAAGSGALVGTELSGSTMPGTADGAKSIVPCGRPGGRMCTLCDLIKGMNVIIQYIMKIAIGGALLALAIGGVMYVVSAGDSGAAETAKSTIKNAAIGFVIIFAAWLIVGTTIKYLGTKPTMGMNTATTWGQFDCTANPNR